MTAIRDIFIVAVQAFKQIRQYDVILKDQAVCRLRAALTARGARTWQLDCVASIRHRYRL